MGTEVKGWEEVLASVLVFEAPRFDGSLTCEAEIISIRG